MHCVRVTQHFLIPVELLPVESTCNRPIALTAVYMITMQMSL